MKIVTAVNPPPNTAMAVAIDFSRILRLSHYIPIHLSLVPPPPHLSITNQVRCIGNGSSNTFATGEQRASNASTAHQRKDCVCVYDASSGPFETLQAQVGLVLCKYVCVRE